MKKNICAQYDHDPEYCVYIHHGKNPAFKKWERASKTNDQSLALEQAQMLYLSNKYEKIEIKKVFFCKNKKKKIDQTYKIFTKNKSDYTRSTNILITSTCIGIIIILLNVIN